MARAPATRRVATGLVVGAASTGLLWWAGHGDLAGPPGPGANRIPTWWADVGPPAAVFGALRLALLAVAAAVATAAVWVLVFRALTAGLRLAGLGLLRCSAGLAARGRRLGRRGLARVALGVSAAGGVLATVGCAPPVRSAGSRAAPVPARSPPAPVLIAPASAPSAGPATGGPVATRGPAPAARLAAGPPPGPPAQTRPPARARTWTTRPGDDFWSIAEAVVAESGGPRPDARVLAAYWSRLISANRDRLPDPGNPSLLFPGDVLIVPPPAPGSG